MKKFWCSSSSWVFSELPKVLEGKDQIAKLKSINTLFTGEFDQVLFEGEGQAKVIDEDMGISIPPKPITELDRLVYVESQLAKIYCTPKGKMKFTPAEKIKMNEAFKGLSMTDAMQLHNWWAVRDP